jgi:phospholipase/carboxylesterase
MESHLNLTHTVYEPAGPGPHPTILTLHGRGANAFDLLGLAPYICGGRFMLICPQGPLETPIGPGAVGYAWYPLTHGGPPDLPAIIKARDDIEAFLDAAAERYPIDRHKTVALGFSQGGVMAYSLALQKPDRFAALVALSSWLPQELFADTPPDARSLPTLVHHGSRDQMIDVQRAHTSVEKLRDWRVPVSFREYEMGHEITAQGLSDLSSWLEEKVLTPIILPR